MYIGKRDVVQSGRTLALGVRGRWFESRLNNKLNKETKYVYR